MGMGKRDSYCFQLFQEDFDRRLSWLTRNDEMSPDFVRQLKSLFETPQLLCSNDFKKFIIGENPAEILDVARKEWGNNVHDVLTKGNLEVPQAASVDFKIQDF